MINGSPMHGTLDDWNWDIRHDLSDKEEVLVWMTLVLTTIMPYFVPTFNVNQLWNEMTAYYVSLRDTEYLKHLRVLQFKWIFN